MAKLRHIAISVPDPEKSAKFFRDPDGIVFDISHHGWAGTSA